MMRTAIGVVVLWIAPALTAHADYTVQIAALRQPSAGLTESAGRFGEVRTVQTTEGITRYQVGRFATAAEARPVRDRLRSAGYTDAFVRHIERPGSVRAATSTEPEAARPLRSVAAPTGEVPAELQDRVVILDGELHVKDGDRFVPLDEYQERSDR